MQTYELTLEAPVFTSFRSQKAANSLDIDASEKAQHHFSVDADLDEPYNVGLIVGASGSGKTTLASHIWGADKFVTLLDPARPVIEQFPEDWDYDDCAAALTGVGLTQVPCWIRPAATLSNGQRERAEIALRLAQPNDGEVSVIDEWTSVVDRTVAKVMSHCIQKHARRSERRIVLLSCHYDVVDWLNPDWIIDCNQQTYADRRSVRRGFKRKEKLKFEVRVCDRSAWSFFSKYHYLSQALPGGVVFYFGLFHGDNQIGFECFANYVPRRRDDVMKLHSNRCVIHPDYAGMGLGLKLIDITSEVMTRAGYEVWAKFSSLPLLRARENSPRWDLITSARQMRTIVGGRMERKGGFRTQVRTYSFMYVPDPTMKVKQLEA